MHLTCWRGRRGHITLGAEKGGTDEGREGDECRDVCVCVLYKRAFFLLRTKEREMEAGSRRKKRRRRRGRCKDPSETKAGIPVKEKTGDGGGDCMRTRGEEACE